VPPSPRRRRRVAGGPRANRLRLGARGGGGPHYAGANNSPLQVAPHASAAPVVAQEGPAYRTTRSPVSYLHPVSSSSPGAAPLSVDQPHGRGAPVGAQVGNGGGIGMEFGALNSILPRQRIEAEGRAQLLQNQRAVEHTEGAAPTVASAYPPAGEAERVRQVRVMQESVKTRQTERQEKRLKGQRARRPSYLPSSAARVPFSPSPSSPFYRNNRGRSAGKVDTAATARAAACQTSAAVQAVQHGGAESAGVRPCDPTYRPRSLDELVSPVRLTRPPASGGGRRAELPSVASLLGGGASLGAPGRGR
jgi:hypothetical protein